MKLSRWLMPRAAMPAVVRAFCVCTLVAVSCGTAGATETADFQRRIDELSSRGGGVLSVAPGVHVIGSVYLKPGVSLHLEEGAVLRGSDDPADYPQVETRIEGETCVYYPALVNADHCDGIRITGAGTIDGHGANTWEEFWTKLKAARARGEDFRNKALMRPRVLYVSNSKDVEVSGVTLKNSKFWTSHFYNCEDIRICGCSIVAEVLKDSSGQELKGPSTDAVDIDKCRNVCISNCYISVNDDGVAIKGGKGAWADDYVRNPGNGPSENVLISNCLFAAPTHSCLTLGSECPEVRGVIMRNCRMENVGDMIYFKMRTDTPQHYSDVLVEGVTGSCENFLHACAWTQYAEFGGRTPDELKSYVTNVVVRNCRVNCRVVRAVEEDPAVFEMTGLMLEDGQATAPCSRTTSDAEPWKDRSKSPEERARLLTAAMTLEEKADELAIHYVNEPALYDFYTNRLAHGRTFGAIMKVKGAKQAREVQEQGLRASRLKIPFIFQEDVTHGYRTVLPVGLGTACTWNEQLVERCEEMAAREAAAAGFHLTYAPMCDISDDPRWGRICETSGESPYLTARITAARVRGFRRHIAACIKHFAGYGSLRAGRDYHPADFSVRELEETYLPPYRAAIAEGVDAVMCAYTPFDAGDCTFNSFLNKTVLRDGLGFRGELMTDWQTIKSGMRYGVTADERESALRAIKAGIDADMRSDIYGDWLPRLVREGAVEEREVDLACARCLAVKFRLGLFDDPFGRGCDEQVEKATLATAANRELAREAVRQGTVLLENLDGVLPLTTDTKIAVVGPLADAPKDQLGDWPCRGQTNETVTLVRGFREAWGDNLVSVDDAGIVIYCAGEKVAWGGEQHSRLNPCVPPEQVAEMRELKARGMRVVAIVLSCRPLVLADVREVADAVLFSFFPGTEGGHGLADLVCGAANPSGHLVQTFPRDPGQIPLSHRERRPWHATKWVDGSVDPLYPFGYGLSYTTFSCSTPEWKDGAAVVTVTNTGRRDGVTVVQAYLRHELSSVVQRERELRSFQRVELEAGESRKVSLQFSPDAFKVFNADHRWVDERRPCTLFVGFDASTTNAVKVDREVADAAEGVWRGSEWLSVKEAPVLAEAESENGFSRAAPGTSWFASEVVNEAEVLKAIWHTTALGVYEVYLNGKPVGEEFLKPGFTHVEKTRRSFVYDVTDRFRCGKGERNVLAAEVSAGWWRDAIVAFHGKKSAFRGVLELEYADGRTVRLGTNTKDWKAGIAGPVLAAAIYDGEEYDARIPAPVLGEGLNSVPEVNPEFRGEILPSKGGEVWLRHDLVMRRGPFALRKGEKLTVDFGQNCAAVPFFSFKAKRGTVLTCLPGEMLNDAGKGERGCDGPKGSVHRANLRMHERGIRAVYTFRGDGGWERYHPRFTFFGYRYAEISATDDVEIEYFESVPVTSIAKAMETGIFETGDESVNRLVSNIRWGQLSNYLSVPTDCPQRDERLGWMADTQVFADAGAYNADTRGFFSKWMRDVRDTQSETGGLPGVAPWARFGSSSNTMMRIGWSDAGVIVPWKLWRQFGDRAIIDENWEAMERFVAHVNETKYDQWTTLSENCVFDRYPYQWADWLSLDKFEASYGGNSPNDGILRLGAHGDVFVFRPGMLDYWNFLGACYWAIDAGMMKEMALATGRDAAKYAEMEKSAKQCLRTKYFGTADGMICEPYGDMQTPAVFALRLGLVDGAAREQTIAFLRRDLQRRGVVCGFLGASLIMDVLCENGMQDLAANRFLSHEFPSWLYSVDQGATTIWERWNAWTKENGFNLVGGLSSFNHYAYGAVLAWMYRYLAGIAPDSSAPGFKKIVMRPIFDRRLGFVKAEYRSAAGLIRSCWRYEGDKVVWEFEIPSGATAVVRLPGEAADTEYGPGVHRLQR